MCLRTVFLVLLGSTNLLLLVCTERHLHFLRRFNYPSRGSKDNISNNYKLFTASIMIELADDFKQRAEEKLSTAVSGTFFKSNNARLLPSFDRETDNDGKDQ